MPKIITVVFALFFLTLISTLFLNIPREIKAAEDDCSTKGITITPTSTLYGDREIPEIDVNVSAEAFRNHLTSDAYFLDFPNTTGILPEKPYTSNGFTINSAGNYHVSRGGTMSPGSSVYINLYKDTSGLTNTHICKANGFGVIKEEIKNANCRFSVPAEVAINDPANPITAGKANVETASISGVKYYFYIYPGNKSLSDFALGFYQNDPFGPNTSLLSFNTWPAGYEDIVFVSGLSAVLIDPKKLNPGEYTGVLVAAIDSTPIPGFRGYIHGCAVAPFKVINADQNSTQQNSSQEASKNPNPAVSIGADTARPCTGEACSKGAGKTCDPKTGIADALPDPKHNGILTAIGCIPTEPVAFVNGFLKFITLISGGIALLLMIFGALRMIWSSGNADELTAGQEQFKSALIGLLFIIFAVLLLEIIGVDILGIPGLTRR